MIANLINCLPLYHFANKNGAPLVKSVLRPLQCLQNLQMHIFLEVLKILNFAFFRMHIKLIQKSRNDSQLHEVMIHIETKIRALVIRSN